MIPITSARWLYVKILFHLQWLGSAFLSQNEFQKQKSH
jgi:hypothetical protein